MTEWEAVLLGVVQGATEFLPVSSSGHLVVGQTLLGIQMPGVYFEVVLHVATLASILFVYRARVAKLCTGAIRGDRKAWRYLGLLLLASLPAAVAGLGFRHRIGELFDRPVVAGVCFLITGSLLWSTRWALRRNLSGMPGPGTALLMGIGQAFALFPGISRSGTTVVLALWLRVEAREAAAFSFLMAVPAIAGAGLLEIPAAAQGESGLSLLALLGGSLAAAVTGILAIRTFVAMLEWKAFHHFAPYLWILGIGFLSFLLFWSGGTG